jgi:RNA recognition motif-containing protein
MDNKAKKSRGYGFVSLGDPVDYIKAMKEMQGQYVGNRPIKLRKSRWKDRLDVDKIEKEKTEHEKQQKKAKKKKAAANKI